MSTALAYLNGRFIPFAEAGLSLSDAGFVSGATVVDNARTFNHKLFRWPDHLARFRRDCRDCYIPLEASDDQITAVAEKLVAHNAKLLPPGGELQLVTFATPGPLGFYVSEDSNGPPTLGMATYSLPFARYRRFFTDGVTLAAAGVQTTDTGDLLPPRIKHRSRLAWHIAERCLRDPAHPAYHPGPAVPVIFSPSGRGDTAIGGILLVMDGKVIRQAPGTVQDSISIIVVGELCAEANISMISMNLDLRCLCTPSEDEFRNSYAHRVTEVMLAGTGFCLAGVRAFTSGPVTRTYPWPGPVFQRLLAIWNERVGVKIETQMAATPHQPD